MKEVPFPVGLLNSIPNEMNLRRKRFLPHWPNRANSIPLMPRDESSPLDPDSSASARGRPRLLRNNLRPWTNRPARSPTLRPGLTPGSTNCAGGEAPVDQQGRRWHSLESLTLPCHRGSASCPALDPILVTILFGKTAPSAHVRPAAAVAKRSPRRITGRRANSRMRLSPRVHRERARVRYPLNLGAPPDGRVTHPRP